MENQSKAEENKKEEKVGVIPASEIKGSDADKAYSEESQDTDAHAEQNKGADSNSNE